MNSLQYLEVVFCFLSLTELTRFSILSFVLWSFQVLGKDLMDYRIRSGKILSLGMPRMASPLSSSSIGNLTWSYIFIRHMICVLLRSSFYFVSICFLLFIIMFCISIFNKNDSSKGLVVAWCHATKYVSRLNLCTYYSPYGGMWNLFCRAGHYPGVHNLL